VDEALGNAARATERTLDRTASLGVRRHDQDSGEASDFDLADSKAAQTVMRAVTAYPLSDAQLERIVKLALGKRILEAASQQQAGAPPGPPPRWPGPSAIPRLRRRVQRGLQLGRTRRRPRRSLQSGLRRVQQ